MKVTHVLGGIIALIVVAAVVFIFVMPLFAAPHLGFPSTSQVDSATGDSNYTASSVISTPASSAGSPPGGVKAESRYFNNTAGSLQFGIIQFKSTSFSNKEFLNLTTLFSPLLKISGGSMQNMTYRGASIVVLDILGHSGFAYGKLGDYIFAVIYSQHSSLVSSYISASTMKSLIQSEVDAMTS
ncbi:MAG: hypothetical protein M1422_01295 [Candidatus Thermoplasmatota archaeon]|jgi:hypothetical protein|nr:hypothetical protein [Candidatus Sysuiplasma jiujiangense]MBX8640160.1 hypothetical protein [Candidatus Sysuiplasma jiujiangense]MBX8642653.1 hypothetical protein [Candidatus Sysuiplasma jiujiangense]MCL4316894.1 hypothetical protein [Candidatus Thermoplasmatota archaeon]MCL5253734.1 hypothetical protein [Candidatus Thermoplasmatota archaeon]